MSPYRGNSAVVVGVVPSRITARHFIVLPEDKFRIGSLEPLNNGSPRFPAYSSHGKRTLILLSRR